MSKVSSVLRRGEGCYLHYCDGCDSYHKVDVEIPNSHTGSSWTFDGNLENPTFSPSINIVGMCHYFIQNGFIIYCQDSKHSLAGKTVPLPKLPNEDCAWD